MPAQQYLPETLGVEPAGEDERPARRSQSAAWQRNLAAARQFYAREGHLTVPRKDVESVDGEQIPLGSFVANSRRRAAKLSPERHADLDRPFTGQEPCDSLPLAQRRHRNRLRINSK